MLFSVLDQSWFNCRTERCKLFSVIPDAYQNPRASTDGTAIDRGNAHVLHPYETCVEPSIRFCAKQSFVPDVFGKLFLFHYYPSH